VQARFARGKFKGENERDFYGGKFANKTFLLYKSAMAAVFSNIV
jgi:hypothetical protein